MELQRLKAELTECIGCGCLSLDRCRLANPNERAAGLGRGQAIGALAPDAVGPNVAEAAPSYASYSLDLNPVELVSVGCILGSGAPEHPATPPRILGIADLDITPEQFFEPAVDLSHSTA